MAIANGNGREEPVGPSKYTIKKGRNALFLLFEPVKYFLNFFNLFV
jgi:hypothetical protein